MRSSSWAVAWLDGRRGDVPEGVMGLMATWISSSTGHKDMKLWGNRLDHIR